MQFIDDDPTMTVRDKITLKGKLKKINQLGEITNDTSVNRIFTSSVDRLAQTMDSNNINKTLIMANGKPFSFRSEAHDFFYDYLREGMKDAIQNSPDGVAINKRALVYEAVAATKEHLKDMNDTLMKGGKLPETGAAVAKPKPEAKQDGVSVNGRKVVRVQLPDGPDGQKRYKVEYVD